MERRTFGKTGMEVSVLGFGGAWIGDDAVAPEAVSELFDAAIEHGPNVIDTSPTYGNSEEKIGSVLGDRRDAFLLFSKCGEAAEARLDGEDWTADVIRRSVDRSLQRLRTDRLDLLIIHSCDLATLTKGEVVTAVQRAKEEGKARFIAYSGDNDALEYAVDLGVFDAVMASLNVADQANLPILERARDAGLGVAIKRPIANAAWVRELTPEDYGYDYAKRLQTLDYPDLDLEFALRWTLAGPVHTAITGMTSPDQMRDDAALLGGPPPSPERIAAIRDRWDAAAPRDWAGLT